MRIALAFNRTRAYGRRFCEGIASELSLPSSRGCGGPDRRDWHLEMLSPDPEDMGPLGRFDAIVAHVTDDVMAGKLAAAKVPVVADFYRLSSARLLHDAAGASRIVEAVPDNAAIGSLAAAHFLERGFGNFAFCGYDGIIFSDERRAGFVAALKDRSRDCICYETPPKSLAGFDRKVILREDLTPRAPDARRLGKWLLSLPRPCAVFCCHDLRAFQVLAACKTCGLEVPEDIAILGVDNDALICGFSRPRLSSIDNNAYAVGRAAARALFAMFDGTGGREKVVKVAPLGVCQNASTDRFAYSSAIVNGALGFIRAHLPENLTASNVFAHLGKSHTIVDREFRETLGRSVQGEIRRQRLDEARRLLLDTPLTIAEVAKASGFSSIRYFMQDFNRAFGLSPSALRKEGLQK